VLQSSAIVRWGSGTASGFCLAGIEIRNERDNGVHQLPTAAEIIFVRFCASTHPSAGFCLLGELFVSIQIKGGVDASQQVHVFLIFASVGFVLPHRHASFGPDHIGCGGSD
jgi:hypothetical protein